MAYNSDHFNLDNWKITLPVDSSGGTSGTAKEILNLDGYESSFFYDAPDRGMVFKASVGGATTSGSKYPRSELREMNGDSLAKWNLKQGGTMSATLKVDAVPTKSDGSPGRIVVGQIHGQDEELVRLYYENGKVYFMNDQAGSENQELKFTFKNSSGQEPSISMGEKFSYSIDAHGDTLKVNIFADGQTYTSTTKINSVWQSDTFYFKAGLYLGVNDDTGSGTGQVSFYGLDFSHTAGGGMGGWRSDVSGQTPTPLPEEPTPLPEEPEEPTNPTDPNLVELRGDDGNNQLNGGSADEVLRGYEGNDVLKGGGGDDELWGNQGDDILIGGAGADMLKGGGGRDTYTFNSLSEAGDTIVDFSTHNRDRIDVSNILEGASGFKNGSAFQDGFIQVTQKGADTEVYIDRDGKAGSGQKTLLATLKDESASGIKEAQFVLPEDTAPGEETPTPPPVEEDPDLPFEDTTASLTVRGNDANNVLFGGHGSDIIKGYAGNDTLYGGGGDDYLEGNDGDDILVGGHGADRIKGSYGIDTYAYLDALDFGDTLTEFRSGEHIDLSAIDFRGAEGMSVSEMMQAGYLSVSRTSSTTAKVYADLDGASGSQSAMLVANLMTHEDQDLGSSIFIA